MLIVAEIVCFPKKLRVPHDEAPSMFKPFSTWVPQGGVLEPLFYYCTHIPTSKLAGTFADDTVIMAKYASQPKALEKPPAKANTSQQPKISPD